MVNVGIFDIDVFEKVVWFVCICDFFNILVFIFVDIFGFLFGVE